MKAGRVQHSISLNLVDCHKIQSFYYLGILSQKCTACNTYGM